jgi:hypothetical protein
MRDILYTRQLSSLPHLYRSLFLQVDRRSKSDRRMRDIRYTRQLSLLPRLCRLPNLQAQEECITSKPGFHPQGQEQSNLGKIRYTSSRQLYSLPHLCRLLTRVHDI